MTLKTKIVILISGSGSNLQAFIDGSADQSLNADIVAVMSNKPDAYGLTRAQQAGIETAVVDHKQFASREAFDAQLQKTIDQFSPDLVILAGFMRILTEGFVQHFKGRLLNIHPSLLPKYPGLNTHQRALDAGDKEAGVSVHFVTEELDGGPIIIQAAVPIENNDTADSLQARVLEKEHIIYPLAAQWFCEKRLYLNNQQVILDNEPLTLTNLRYDNT